jgi:hypothetical protein
MVAEVVIPATPADEAINALLKDLDDLEKIEQVATPVETFVTQELVSDPAEILVAPDEPVAAVEAAPEVGETAPVSEAAAEAPAKPEKAAKAKGKGKGKGKGGGKKCDAPVTPEAVAETVAVEPAPAPEATEEVVPEKAKPGRKYHASRVDLMKEVLGGDLASTTLLTVEDAEATPEDQAKIRENTLASFQTVGKKVQNRMSYILEFAAGKKATLNTVITKAFNVLRTAGEITSGDKGNLMAALTESYTPGAARAMGNNTIAAMRTLKIISKKEDGVYIPNESSLLLPQIRMLLDLVPPSEDEGEDE